MMPSPMTKVEQLDNQMAMINSPDALRKLRGYQSMMQQPVIQREMGGIADAMPEDIPMKQPVNPEEAQVAQQGAEIGASRALEVAEQIPPEMQEQYAGDVAELKEAARGLAAMGRMGDTELVHMTADELSGLHSMGQLTYNPITGLPEAFSLKGFTKIFSPIRALAKPIKNVMKSKAFKTLAPIVLGIAAPYALAGMGAFGLTSVAAMSPLAFGATTALGTGLGSLLAGQKPSDALKSALISGVTAGTMRGIGNKMAGKPFMGGAKTPPPTGELGKYSGDFGRTSYQPMSSTPTGTPAGQVNPNLSSYGDAAKNITGPGVTGASPSDVASMAYPGGSGTVPIEQAVYPGGGSNIPTKPIITKEPGTFDKLASKDFYKDIGSEMKKDFIVPKDDGGISVLGTGKKILGAVAPTQAGEMAADASAMARKEEELLSEEDYLNSPYKEMFPTYQAYTTNYFKRLQPTQYADEASAVQRFVAAGGGQPMQTAAGGEFSGMVPGQGGGMEDNVFMPIKEGREQVGTLAVSPTEYVVDSYTMAALGGGNPDEGAKVMDKTVEQIRKKAYGTTEQPNEIDGLRSLVPLTRSVA